jgi:hypothetical protein
VLLLLPGFTHPVLAMSQMLGDTRVTQVKLHPLPYNV